MTNYFVHPTALVESEDVGVATEIFAFVHILSNARVGDGCEINDRVYIGNNVNVGNEVNIGAGAYLTGNLIVEDNVYIGPNVVFHKNINTDKNHADCEPEETKVLYGASIGANVTIPLGTIIGKNSVINDGSVIDSDVPQNAIISGNPAQIVGYKSAGSPSVDITHVDMAEAPNVGITNIGVGDVAIHKLPKITDLRGSLTFAQYGQYLPFTVKRYFVIYDVLSDKVRGEHAHRNLHQFLVCVKGQCSVIVDDGADSKEVKLSTPEIGLHITPGVWGIQYKFTKDAVLVVFASDEYDDKDYIRSYDEFLSLVK
jgi:UDP-2-acetamido-3-amino-2,3-dideoxy-glucuronate N-acetyltransferase